MRHFLRILGMAEPSERAKRKIAARIAANKCLIDGCEDAPDLRGCCDKHYRQFNRELNAIHNDRDRVDFEAECIRKGLILANQEIRSFRTPSPFAEALKG